MKRRCIPLDWWARESRVIPRKTAFCERRFRLLLSMVVRQLKKLRLRSWAVGIVSHMDFWRCSGTASEAGNPDARILSVYAAWFPREDLPARLAPQACR